MDSEYEGAVEDKNMPISFSSAADNMTRASDKPLSEYVQNFRVYGMVKTADGGYDPAFNNYKVWYTEHSAYTTVTNSKGWEYVSNDLDPKQYVKYWDYSCPSYMFWAVADADKASFTYNKETGTVTASINLSNSDNTTFIATPKVVNQKDYNKPVTLKFRNVYPQVRVGFYETIPGYVVKDMKFYASTDATTSSTDASLLGSFPSSNTLSLSYNVNNPTVETLSYGTPTSTANTIELGQLAYATDVKEKILTAGSYLNQTSSLPTYAAAKNVVPGDVGSIAIKCDYTLIGTDFANEADNERIHVKGATAVVPADYCNWQPGYTYTYVFKITRNTNGSTGSLDGLYPINFDAVTTEGEQQTVTLLEENYIITYQKGINVTGNFEYNAGTIYATVGDGTTDFDTNKAKLYEVTLTGDPKCYVSVSSVQAALNTTPTGSVYSHSYSQNINGENCTATIKVTDQNTPALTAVTSIPADATVDGVERNVKAASFTAVAGKIYVLRYDVDTNKVAYKVIKVKTE